jgi:hypothetical protein
MGCQEKSADLQIKFDVKLKSYTISPIIAGHKSLRNAFPELSCLLEFRIKRELLLPDRPLLNQFMAI